MGYELYYEGRIAFDRPVSLDRPDAEEHLCNLTRFFAPVFEQVEGTSTGRRVTGFEVDEEIAEDAKSLLWEEGLVAIAEFARRHQVTLTPQLRWQGDRVEDRGHVVFDVHGDHHQVLDSDNNKAVEAHRQRSCTCYRDPAPDPMPAPARVAADPAVGPPTPVRNGHLTDYTAHCTDHGQIVFTPDENLARTLRNEHIARHHG
ncbi:hypothetical protein ACFWGI_40215 [Streptomyces niveus]|uniref:hypothetical protein n=1 Tax=Streptomyces niveus TaxID=193462 RepID=UPI003646E7B8